MHPELVAWERAAQPTTRISPPHHRNGASPPTPHARINELTGLLEQTRVMLAAACAEIRRLDKPGRFHTFQGTSFAGTAMAQYWVDLVVWEAVLNENPQLRTIVELGTWTGGFSLWLHAQCEARRMVFRTYDSIKPERQIPGFVRADIFHMHKDIGGHMQNHEPLILFCDNGNKPRELKVFPPYLRHPGSLVAVHDWGTETLPSDVPDNLTMVYGDYCDELGGVTRFFKVKDNEQVTDPLERRIAELRTKAASANRD